MMISYKHHDYSIMSKAVEFEEVLIMIMIIIKRMVKAWPAYQVLTYNMYRSKNLESYLDIVLGACL